MVPCEITLKGGKELTVLWDDGHESLYSVRGLRLQCPCAMCVDEWTGESRLDPASLPPDLRAERVEPVGNYAIAVQFSDGHSTGIYSFEKLRALCPCCGSSARRSPR